MRFFSLVFLHQILHYQPGVSTMNDTAALAENDPILGSDFMVEMVRQLRALDTFGAWEGKGAAEVLDPLVLTAERRQSLPLVGDPDEETMARVKAFYNGIAALIEKECGLMAVPMMSLSHEGFGRVIITVGKLVVLDRALRDVHRFGFASLSKMKDEADKYLSVALELIGAYPKAAGM
jgi:probable nitrogen fixation protein